MRFVTAGPRRPTSFLLIITVLILAASAIGPPEVGWVFFSADPLPAGTALFSFVDNEGVLIWEAGIPAVESGPRGRLFVDQTGTTSTGVAIANVLPFDTILDLVLRDEEGAMIGQVDFPLPGNEQRALFVDQIFDELPDSFIGSLTYQTSEETHRVATVTVRGNTNARNEPLFATLDVIDLGGESEGPIAVLPQIGGAPTLSTQIVLVERSGRQTSGEVRLFDSQGAPLELDAGDDTSSTFAYDLAADGVMRLDLTRSDGTGVGYAVVSADNGSVVPSASAIFQFRLEGSATATNVSRILSEAGVLARPATTHGRLFVDTLRTMTGVALASPGNPETEVTFRLIRDDGTFRQVNRTVAAAGHLAIFADELFPGLDRRDDTLDILSPSPLYLTTLKLSSNERSEPVLTTLPVLDVNEPTSGLRFFPQVATGGGLSTRLIFVNAGDSAIASPSGPASLGPYLPGGEESPAGRGGGRLFFDEVDVLVGSNDLPLNFHTPSGVQTNPFRNLDLRLTSGSEDVLVPGEESAVANLNSAQEAFNNPAGPGGPFLHRTQDPGFGFSQEVEHEIVSLLLDEFGGLDPNERFRSSDSLPGGIRDSVDMLDSEHECEDCGHEDSHFEGNSDLGVYLNSRELFYTHVDLAIPGRGFPWRLARKYRSRTQHNGILGHNWFLNYSRRLIIIPENQTPLDEFGFPPAVPRFEPGDAVRMDGLSRVDVYKQSPDGSYRAPRFFYTKLVRLEDGAFLERDSQGNKTHYDFPDGAGVARMVSQSDRFGNTMRFQHDRSGRLVRVIDTLGRPITYHYNADGRLVRVQDFLGRVVRFSYDESGDLVESTTPAVTGTPNSNDFPEGKTTRYVYRNFDSPRFGHDLIQLFTPNDVAEGADPPRVQVLYADDFVFRLTVGGINASGVPAGGPLRYSDRYLVSGNPFDPDLDADINEVVAETDVTDRNGNLTTYGFNKLGNVLSRKELTNRDVRPGDPEFYETRFEYNEDGERLRLIRPAGNSFDYFYDDSNPDRFQQGNRLRLTRQPDPARSGDQEEITTTFEYEPVYNQLRVVTEPRGNDPAYVPQNGGASSPQRYQTELTYDYQEGANLEALSQELQTSIAGVQTLLERAGVPVNLGDINNDGITDDTKGDLLRVERPSVHLLQDSNLSTVKGSDRQPILSLSTFNRFGQVTSTTDPEGNVTEYDYHPENDPDGDGANRTPGASSEPFGYLRQITRDTRSDPDRNSGTNPTPATIRTQFLYDAAGNLTRLVDGRGIRTELSVNQLNQVVQITRAAGHNAFSADPEEPEQLTDFRYLERLFYDFNDNLILRQLEDRGNSSMVDGNLPTVDLPATASDPDPTGGPAFVDTVSKYDILDNLIESLQEVGAGSSPLRTRYRYDPNTNAVLIIHPEGNASATTYDERDFSFQETMGATSPPAEALVTETDPADYDVRGGSVSMQTFHYDLNGNLIEKVDAADTDTSDLNNSSVGGEGDRTRYVIDGFDRLTSIVDSVGNQQVFQYDPSSNLVRASFFGPTGGDSPVDDGPDVLPGPVSVGGEIQIDRLVNGSLLEARETLYDELSRPFQRDGVLFGNTISTTRPADLADGASDIGKGDLTPGDNQPIPGLNGVDILGRVSTRVEYDRNSRPAFRAEDDGDVHQSFYDGVDRVLRRVDAEGNSIDMAYDDNHNLIEVLETDVSQTPNVADELFLTTFFYDSLNRREKRVDNLGQTHDFRYDSRNNLVSKSDASGPNGPEIGRRAFPTGPLTSNTINLFGNVTRYSYDGINRRVETEVILTSTGLGDGTSAGADLFGIKGSTPEPDPAQGGGDGRAMARLIWDRNSLIRAGIDDNGNKTEYEYDNLNRIVSRTQGICVEPALASQCDPPTTNTYGYDPDHNLTSRTDENGSAIVTRFDALNRAIGTDITRGPGVIGTTEVAYEYDGLSRTVAAFDNNEPASPDDDSSVTVAYDSLSRIIEESQRLGDLPAQIISSSWRAENLKVARIYPNDRRVETTFDSLDRIDQISDEGAALPIVDYDYIGRGRVAQRRHPLNGTRMTFLDNGATSDVGYDGLRRPIQLRHLRGDDSQIVGFTHTYDRMDNRLSQGLLHDPANSESYQYDSAYRLTGFDRPNPDSAVAGQSRWTLDGVGNWVQVDGEAREHTSFNEIASRNNSRLLELDSDQNGNSVDDGSRRFAWDYRNRLRSIGNDGDPASIATYTYDALNRRSRKNVGGSETTGFAFDGWQVLEERDQTSQHSKEFVYGALLDEPLQLIERELGSAAGAGSGTDGLFYHQNTLSSTFALTELDGSIRESYLYDAYGRTTFSRPNEALSVDPKSASKELGASGAGNPYLFQGRRYDAESKNFYFRFRYHDPVTGRFLSRDPLSADATSSLYSFAAANPINRVDPMGLEDETGLGEITMAGVDIEGGFIGGVNISFGSVRRDGEHQGFYASFSLGVVVPGISISYEEARPEALGGAQEALGPSDLSGPFMEGAVQGTFGPLQRGESAAVDLTPGESPVAGYSSSSWGLGDPFPGGSLRFGGTGIFFADEDLETTRQRWALATRYLADHVNHSCGCCRAAASKAQLNRMVRRMLAVQVEYERGLRESLP